MKVFTGTTISPNYDPLIAKVMNHAKTRSASIKGMDLLLSRSQICGPPSNLDFLAAIMSDDTFKSGNTITSFLKTFEYAPGAIDVISAGAQTLVEGQFHSKHLERTGNRVTYQADTTPQIFPVDRTLAKAYLMLVRWTHSL